MDCDRLLLIGFDSTETQDITSWLGVDFISHEMLPRIPIVNGQLEAQHPRQMRMLPISHVIFHGIFENDLDILAALAFWNGPCFPNPMSMMDCRLRLPCLAKALTFSRFGGQRGFVSAGLSYPTESLAVAKWGNWHCGENKETFTTEWIATEPTLVEPFQQGEAIRLLKLGDKSWQIRMTGKDWRKSVHGQGSEIMPIDQELLDDTTTIQRGMNLDIIANDYMVHPFQRYLLEVNHIPSVTCFPEIWSSYIHTITQWLHDQRNRSPKTPST